MVKIDRGYINRKILYLSDNFLQEPTTYIFIFCNQTCLMNVVFYIMIIGMKIIIIIITEIQFM